MTAVDRADLECAGAMLATALGIGFNIAYLQALSGFPEARLVLVAIFAGLAVALSGLPSHIRERGRTLVFVDRVALGALTYLALSATLTILYQPRPF